jgi:hypothetical protein
VISQILRQLLHKRTLSNAHWVLGATIRLDNVSSGYSPPGVSKEKINDLFLCHSLIDQEWHVQPSFKLEV